jgi:hypothetical protein
MRVASLAFLDPDLEDQIYADPDPKHISVVPVLHGGIVIDHV